jgi:hypothetical protein
LFCVPEMSDLTYSKQQYSWLLPLFINNEQWHVRLHAELQPVQIDILVFNGKYFDCHHNPHWDCRWKRVKCCTQWSLPMSSTSSDHDDKHPLPNTFVSGQQQISCWISCTKDGDRTPTWQLLRTKEWVFDHWLAAKWLKWSWWLPTNSFLHGLASR